MTLVKNTLATAGFAIALPGTAIAAQAAAPTVDRDAPASPITSQTAPKTVDFPIRFGTGYFNGYRGQRRFRPGYRRYNGFYFPRRAFSAPRYERRVVRRGLSGRHYRWCDAKYRSYRASDNTFQPHGNRPRQRFNSPNDGF